MQESLAKAHKCAYERNTFLFNLKLKVLVYTYIVHITYNNHYVTIVRLFQKLKSS